MSPGGLPTRWDAETGGYATTRSDLSIERQHAVEFLAAAHDQAGGGDHAVGPLFARELRVLLDPVDRDFAGAAEHGKHGPVAEKVDGVVAPFAGGDLPSIEPEDAVEFTPVEGHPACGGE